MSNGQKTQKYKLYNYLYEIFHFVYVTWNQIKPVSEEINLKHG